MEQNIIQTDVVKAVAAIKSAIQLTRKTMMLSANKNALALYYGIGRYICQSQKRSSWGDKMMHFLQYSLPIIMKYCNVQTHSMKDCFISTRLQVSFGVLTNLNIIYVSNCI